MFFYPMKTILISLCVFYSLLVKANIQFINTRPVIESIGNVTMNEGDTLEIRVLTCDPDNDPISLHILNLPAFGTFTDQGGGMGLIRLTPLYDAGRYQDIHVFVKDLPGSSDTVTFHILVNKVMYRINAGGVEEWDLPLSWEMDKQTTPSTYLDSSSSNHTTGSNVWKGPNSTNAPNNIFGSNRYNVYAHKPMRWNFPVTNGTYKVNLYFAERSVVVNQEGQRVFRVTIEDELALDNFDIYREARYAALVKSFIRDVSDDTLNIAFDSIVNYAQVNAIEIIQIGEDFPMAEDISVSEVIISPNPFLDKVTLSFNENIRGSVEVFLFNNRGQLCYNKTQHVGCGKIMEHSFQSMELPIGIYYLKISSENINKVFRLVHIDAED